MRITRYKTELKDGLPVLVKENSTNYQEENLSEPVHIYNLMTDVFRLDKQAEEYIYLIATNTKNKPIGIFEVSHGSVNTSITSPREVFIRLLLCGAVNFFLVHNHPSQDCTPSKSDLDVTARIKECAQLLGLTRFNEHGLL